jgi:CDP-diacylglycerol--glycerol-3-phosphate 3-phosphatidyltransferase
MRKEKIVNVPNVLSAYRILALPFIVWSIVIGNKQLFITLLSINLITDILDGLIARAFKLETEFGARLDSLADMGTYLMAVSGMILLENAFVIKFIYFFIILICLYLVPQLIAVFRFRKTTSFHLYSTKIVAYIQGIFIFSHFVWGAYLPYFYFMFFASCISYFEELIIVAFMPELRSNVKGIYFMLREHKSIR